MSYVNGRRSPNGATRLISRRGYGGVSGVTDDIGSFIKTGFKGALDFYGQQKKTEGQKEAYESLVRQQQAQAQGGTPGWLLPVAGVGAVVAVALILKRRKK